MQTSSPAREGSVARRAAVVGAVLAALAPVVPPGGAVAQTSNAPIVQVICVVNGGAAQTVRITYPATAVKNLHLFKPVNGGTNIVLYPPATATQVYNLVVPAGRYKLSYATQAANGSYPMIFTNYGPVIDIPPFKVVGRICERSQVVGSPSS